MFQVKISVSQFQPYWLNQFEKNWKEHSFEFIKNLILNRFLLVIYIRIFLSFRKQKLPCSSHVMKQSSSPAESSAHFIAAIFNNNQTVVWVGGVSGRFHHTYKHRELALLVFYSSSSTGSDTWRASSEQFFIQSLYDARMFSL